MGLHSIYFFANSWPLVIAMLSSFLCIYIFGEIYGKIKHGKELSFASDTLFEKLSRDARKILVILFHILMIMILMFGSNYFIVNICDSKVIRCMPEGTYCYYANVTNEKEKTYILPAKIYKYDLSTYGVDSVYFDNGGYLYFSCSDDFEFHETQTCVDQREREWEIELTNYKTSHEKVTETKSQWSSDDTFRLVMILLQLSLIAAHILCWKPKEDIVSEI